MPINKELRRVQIAKWHAENPERVRANREKYRALYPDRIRGSRAKYKAEHPETEKAITKAWKENHPQVMRIYDENRRARKINGGGKLSNDLVIRLLKLQKGKCPCCGVSLAGNYHLDHKMPLALGGLHEDSNMQLLRSECNLQKRAKHPIDFMQSRGFLL